jgi:hypothetical protein
MRVQWSLVVIIQKILGLTFHASIFLERVVAGQFWVLTRHPRVFYRKISFEVII